MQKKEQNFYLCNTPMQDKVKLFIGSSDDHDAIAEKVYLYSLYKNTTKELDITIMRPSNMGDDWNRFTWGTPFTCYRYAIPEMMGFEGKALYTDVDMLNYRDISKLYETDLEGKAFGMCWDALQDNGKKGKEEGYPRGWWCDSVMLIDCAKAAEFIDPLSEMKKWNKNYSYKWEVMRRIGSPDKTKGEKIIHLLDSRWNSFDGTDASVMPDNYDPFGNEVPNWEDKAMQSKEDIWQLHLTALSYQPWHPKYSPHAKAGHVRPDLLREWWRTVKIVNNL